jgi:DNA-directed RNA polymerase subunit omega
MKGITHTRVNKITGSRYASVTATAKRARQLTNYFRDDEQSYDEQVGPMVEIKSKHPLSIAEEEIAQGKLKVHYRR